MKEWYKKSYMFNVQDAIDHGVDIAIMLHHFRFWLDKNVSNGKHIYDGNYWTYNSSRAFQELMPFWSHKKTQRVLSQMREKGLILCGNYNKAGFDRTLWYSMPEYATTGKTSLGHNEPMQRTDLSNALDEIVQCKGQICPTDCTDLSNAKDRFVQAIPDSKLQIVNSDSKQHIKEIEATASDSHLFLNKISKKYHEDVLQVLEHWSKIMKTRFNPEQNSKVNQDRAKHIAERLKEGYTLDQCFRAIEGCSKNEFNMASDGKNKTLYNDIKYIFTPERIERHLSHRNVAQTITEARGESAYSRIKKRIREAEEVDVTPSTAQYEHMTKM